MASESAVVDASTAGERTPDRWQLFGGGLQWQSSDWAQQDDSIRGGKSVSYMNPTPNGTRIVFQGAVDDETLGGAGFASQRTTGSRDWDLRAYDGLELVIKRGHYMDKVLTCTLKDDIPPPEFDGVSRDDASRATEAQRRENPKTTVSYEYDFRPSNPQPEGGEKIFVPWDAFRPSYRGRDKDDAPPLDLGSVKRLAFMVRSFFGKQSGPFQVSILGVAAVRRPVPARVGFSGKYWDEYDELDEDEDDYGGYSEKDGGGALTRSGKGREQGICGSCVVQ